MPKLYTKEQLIKKYAGKFINIYPHHYTQRDKAGNWIVVYELRGVSPTIRENYNLPNDAVTQ